MKEGVLEWNKAFESAGFSNAIEVKVQPDDADWDAGDIDYNVLRWTSSPNPPFGAMVQALLILELVKSSVQTLCLNWSTLPIGFVTTNSLQANQLETNKYPLTLFNPTPTVAHTASSNGANGFGTKYV